MPGQKTNFASKNSGVSKTALETTVSKARSGDALRDAKRLRASPPRAPTGVPIERRLTRMPDHPCRCVEDLPPVPDQSGPARRVAASITGCVPAFWLGPDSKPVRTARHTRT